MTAKTTLLSRREFVKLATQVGVSAAVVGAFMQIRGALTKAKAGSHGPVSDAYHWVMVIDLGRCTGCNYCTYACKATNDTAPGITWNAVFNDRQSFAKEVYLARPCMHCEHAPCVEVCPVGATYHRADGLVAMDYDLCIGCRYCQIACPYGARYFNWEDNNQPNPMAPEWGKPEIERRPRGVVEKCTFCAHRIDAGLENGLRPGIDEDATPACVNICPVKARQFGDLNDPDSKVSKLLAERESIQLREDLGTHPRVYYMLPERGEDQTCA
jgi:phenylacetyl-CoA:acceptor oxidoreductase subunit 1